MLSSLTPLARLTALPFSSALFIAACASSTTAPIPAPAPSPTTYSLTIDSAARPGSKGFDRGAYQQP